MQFEIIMRWDRRKCRPATEEKQESLFSLTKFSISTVRTHLSDKTQNTQKFLKMSKWKQVHYSFSSCVFKRHVIPQVRNAPHTCGAYCFMFSNEDMYIASKKLYILVTSLQSNIEFKWNAARPGVVCDCPLLFEIVIFQPRHELLRCLRPSNLRAAAQLLLSPRHSRRNQDAVHRDHLRSWQSHSTCIHWVSSAWENF